MLELEDIEKDSSLLIERVRYSDRKSRSTKNRFRQGDVLYGKLRPYLNKVLIADRDGYCTTEIVPIRATAAVDRRYLFYWLKHPEFLEYVTGVSHGLNMPRLGTDAGRNAPFILAPLREQRQIAAALDSIFQRLGRCRQRLEVVPALLKRIREAVLEAAVSGRLTEEWRQVHGIDQSSWRSAKIGELVTALNGRAFPSIDYSCNGVRLVRPGNLHPSGRVQWNDQNTVRLPESYTHTHKQYLLGQGELLMNLTAQSLKDNFLGRVCIKDDPEPVLLNQRICAFRSIGPEDVRPYLFVYFRAPSFRRFVDTLDTGTLIKHMYTKDVLAHEVSLPTQAEQQEIFRRVDALFTLAANLEGQCGEAKLRIDRLMPAILTKAFEGQLVAQDSSEELSREMLERIKGGHEAREPSELRRPLGSVHGPGRGKKAIVAGREPRERKRA